MSASSPPPIATWKRTWPRGVFRRDLYFRLRVLEIVVPALRKRPEDIPLLADYFLHKYNAETGRKIRGFSADAKENCSATSGRAISAN